MHSFSKKKYILAHKYVFSLYSIILFLHVIMNVYLPLRIARFIDSCISGASNNDLDVLIFFMIIQFFLSCIMKELNFRLSNQIAFAIEYDAFCCIEDASYMKIKKIEEAYLAQRINNDAVCVGDYFVEQIPFFVADLLLILLCLLILLFTNFRISLFWLLAGTFSITMYFLIKKVIYNRKAIMLEKQGAFFATLSNDIFSVSSIKLNAWQKWVNSELKKSMKNFYDSSLNFLRIDFLYNNITELYKYVIYVINVFMLCSFINVQDVSFGEVTLLLFYIELIFLKLQKCLNFLKDYEVFRVSLDRLEELFSVERESCFYGSTRIGDVKKISVENLNVEMEGKVILSIGHASFEKGKVYLLKGRNGAGKTTLINTILGLYPEFKGKITYNETDIKSININDLREKHVAFVEQEPLLCNGTIYDNLTRGISELNVEKNDILNFLKEDFLSFVMDIESGFYTEAFGKNTVFSGGEKQKIAIARALIKDVELLIMDEPTSALDIGSCIWLCRYLKEIKNQKIIIISSHDKLMLDVADEVIEI